MSDLRVFLAHPKDSTDEQIATMVEQVAAVLDRLQKQNGGRAKVVVVTGRDDFNERVLACGGWEGWCNSVGSGMMYRGGERGPIFDLIVVAPSNVFGMGTARIVEAALREKRPVFVQPDEDTGHLYPVQYLSRQSEKSFKLSHYASVGAPI